MEVMTAASAGASFVGNTYPLVSQNAKTLGQPMVRYRAFTCTLSELYAGHGLQFTYEPWIARATVPAAVGRY
jgi:hypothetical protein